MLARTWSVGRGGDILRGALGRMSGQVTKFLEAGIGDRPSRRSLPLPPRREPTLTLLPLPAGSELAQTLAELERTRAELDAKSQMLAEIADRTAKSKRSDRGHVQARAKLIAGISHELRTPLNAVIGFSDVMERELFGPLGHDRYRDYAVHIRESGHHLLRATEDILALTRVASGAVEIADEPFDVDELLREVWRYLQADLKGREIVCERPGDSELQVSSDRRALRQALINLVSETIAARQPATLTISARLDGGMLEIAVAGEAAPADGTARDEAPRRLRPGQGLAVSRMLIELLGGAIDDECPSQASFRLTCRLPSATCGTVEIPLSAEPMLLATQAA
jgi:two-component system cell cycle sensor histidine kinase PleC